MSAPLRFHARAPSGQWLNDPNALFAANGRYRLYVQHRADPPDFVRVGWAAFASDDLLHWEFEGMVIAPAGEASAYSGSITDTGGALAIWYTEDVRGMERQLCIRSTDGGSSWSAPVETLEPAERDWRDPFLLTEDSGTAMLIARPCGWSTWADDAPSTIEIRYQPHGMTGWPQTGRIGPWRPAGVMWEVPVLVPHPAGHGHRLLISEMDRREGRAEGHVSFWDGAWRDGAFVPTSGEGQPIDCGPDFYAAIPNLSSGWPSADRVIVGWASSWQTARAFPWPDCHGGPISLPRRLTPLGSAPVADIVAAFGHIVDDVPLHGMGALALPGGAFVLEIVSGANRLTIVRSAAGALQVTRSGEEWLCWQRDFAATGHEGDVALTLFLDGPLIELHIGPDDRWVTAVLPVGAAPVRVSLPFSWFTLG